MKKQIISKKETKSALVYFADIAIEALEENKTLPAKFKRLLALQNLKRVKDKKVVIKMHLGGN